MKQITKFGGTYLLVYLNAREESFWFKYYLETNIITSSRHEKKKHYNMHKKNQFCTPILLTRCRYPKRFFKDFLILHTHPVSDFWPIDILKLLLHIH